MFTDMVGYTALGQKHESLSLALVEEQRKLIRPALGRHQGREVKTIGDSFFVEFASALDAARCAYDIQRSVREFNVSMPEERRIHLRIGVHLGDVVESQGDISGDAVNIASRIESLAEDGGVCLTRQVYDQVYNKLDIPMTNLGQRALKNVSSPIEVYKMSMPWEPRSPEQHAGSLDRRRIAVLPFKSMSPDPNDAYFADGLAEELISTLSTVTGLRVVSRTSTMGYKDSPKRLADIGRELSAGAIVEGSIRKAGAQVRITVQLLDANTDEHLWAEKYDRKLDDIFTIQSEVSESVARALNVQLARSERERMAKTKTSDMGAYQDYLLGKHLLLQGTEEKVRKSIELFKRAVAADPLFAEAYHGLADSYELMGHNSYAPWIESMKLSKDAVRKSLELDPDLAGAHATLGFLTMVADWDLIEAQKELKKAIDLDPSDASAHRDYSRCLAALGRLDEACQHARTSRELDPLRLGSYSDEGQMYYLNGKDDEAFAVWAKGRELFPDQDRLLFFPILAHLARGEYEEARLKLSRASPNFVKEPHGMYLLGMINGYLGKSEEALQIASRLEAQVREGRGSGDLLASIYAATGDYDQFFKLASEALKLRHWELYVLKNHDKFFPKLEGDPRWGKLLSEAGLA